MTGACTNPIYYQGHVRFTRLDNVDTVSGVRCPVLVFLKRACLTRSDGRVRYQNVLQRPILFPRR